MENDRSTLEMLKELTENLLIALAPLVAEHLNVMTAVEILKASVTRYMTDHRNLPKETAAAHLGMSERWIYKQLQRSGDGTRARSPVRLEVLQFFCDRQPESVSLGECGRTLEARGIRIDAETLANLVEAYCNFGYLERDGHRYRWKQSVLTLDPKQVTGRIGRVSLLLPMLMALVKRYVECDENTALRQVDVTITRPAYEEMVREIKEAIQVAVERAVRRSYEDNPEGFHEDDVKVEGLFIIGSSKIHPPRKE